MYIVGYLGVLLKEADNSDLLCQPLCYKLCQLPGFQVPQQSEQVYLQLDALETPWDLVNFIYTFPPLKLFPCLLCGIVSEGIPLIFVALNWPRRTGYSDLISLLAVSLLALSDVWLCAPRADLPPCFLGADFIDLLGTCYSYCS